MKLTLSFSPSRFLYMNKMLRQKCKYLENEKSFYDGIKSIFHLFWKAFIKANKKFFWRWECDFKWVSRKLHFIAFRKGKKKSSIHTAFSFPVIQIHFTSQIKNKNWQTKLWRWAFRRFGLVFSRGLKVNIPYWEVF